MFRFKVPRNIRFIILLFSSIIVRFDVFTQSNYELVILRRADNDTLESYFGTSEKGYNSGKAIERIISLGGGKVGQSYCSFGMIFKAKVNRISLSKKINGSAKSWLRMDAIKVYFGKVVSNVPVKKSDVVLIPRTGGSGWHVESVRKWKTLEKEKFLTGGFNTRSPYEHQSLLEGVYPHTRRKNTVIILDYEKFWNLSPLQVHNVCVYLNGVYVARKNLSKSR